MVKGYNRWTIKQKEPANNQRLGLVAFVAFVVGEKSSPTSDVRSFFFALLL
jgi:hypothetical protein